MIRVIVEFKNKLYLLSDDDKLYSTSDGYEWMSENGDISDSNYRFQTLLFELNGKLWSIMKSDVDNAYRFANSGDGKIGLYMVRFLLTSRLAIFRHYRLLPEPKNPKL